MELSTVTIAVIVFIVMNTSQKVSENGGWYELPEAGKPYTPPVLELDKGPTLIVPEELVEFGGPK